MPRSRSRPPGPACTSSSRSRCAFRRPRASDDRGRARRAGVDAHGRQHQALRPGGRAPRGRARGHDRASDWCRSRRWRPHSAHTSSTCRSRCRAMTSMPMGSRWPSARRMPRSPRPSPSVGSRPGPSITPSCSTPLIHELNLLRALPRRADRVSGMPVSPVRRRRSSSSSAMCRPSSPGSTCPGSPDTGRSWRSTLPTAASRLLFPSPFLRNAPTELVIEGGDRGKAPLLGNDEVVAYEEAFKIELIEFADSIAERRAPRTTAEDGLADSSYASRSSRRWRRAVRSAACHEGRGLRWTWIARSWSPTRPSATGPSSAPSACLACQPAKTFCRRLRGPATRASTSVRSVSSVAPTSCVRPSSPTDWGSQAVTRAAVHRPGEPPRRLARAGRRPGPVRCRRVASGIPSASADAGLRPTTERIAHPGQAGRTNARPGRCGPLRARCRVAEALDRCLARGYPPTLSIRSSGPPSRPPTRSRRCST